MTKINRQLGKYFILITMLSIAFVTIIANVSINIFFSNYIKVNRDKDDLRFVSYVEQGYVDYNELNSQFLMSLAHYAASEAVTVRLKDMDNNILWNSVTFDEMRGILGQIGDNEDNITIRNYPFYSNGKQVGTVDVGRPRSIFSTLEDKQFINTINSVFAIAFVFSIVIAILSSSHLSRKFLKPIYQLKENAKLIEAGKYKKLKEVDTNTSELHDLSISVKNLAEKLDYQEGLRKRMTSDIAHELRTPLATIQSHIEAFMDGIWKVDNEKLSVIHDEITRLAKLIKNLSELAVVENDDIKLHKEELNLSKILVNIAENFELLFNTKNIQLNKDIQDNISFIGDADKLNQVFVNILSNAYKYTNEDGLVNVKLTEFGDKIEIAFEDSGIGIPKEDIKNVFERFYRSDISRSRGTGGTGIGLTISKAIVEAHEGRIWIESEVGKGTRVVIEFENKHSADS